MEQQTPPAEESIFDESDFSMKGYDKHVRNARVILYILAGLSLLTFVSIIPIDGPVKYLLTGMTIAMAAVFFILGYWSKKKPYTALLTALIYFFALVLLAAIMKPESLLTGWYVKIAVILFLILGVRNGKQIQDMQKTFGNNS